MPRQYRLGEITQIGDTEMTNALLVKEVAATIAAVENAKPAKASKAPAKAKAKPAAKAAAKPATKAAPKAKTAAKPGASKAQKVKAASAAAYFIHPQFRPVAGARLNAHTEAVLAYFGLYGKGAKVQRRELARVMGETAVGYHLRQTRNFVEVEKGVIALSEVGRLAFQARQGAVDADLMQGFLAVFRTGKAQEVTQVKAEFILTA